MGSIRDYFHFNTVDVGDTEETRRAAVEGNYGKMVMVRRADITRSGGPPKKDCYRLGILTEVKSEPGFFSNSSYWF